MREWEGGPALRARPCLVLVTSLALLLPPVLTSPQRASLLSVYGQVVGSSGLGWQSSNSKTPHVGTRPVLLAGAAVCRYRDQGTLVPGAVDWAVCRGNNKTVAEYQVSPKNWQPTITLFPGRCW